MHISCKLYLTTSNLSISLHKESISAVEGQGIVQLSFWKRTNFENLQNIRVDEACDSFYKCVSVKESKHEFISKTALSRE